MAQPVTILIAALGGQGGGVLAEWLVEAALRAGFRAQGTSIPGVAQRTGATTYYVEIHPEPLATLGGRVPVLGLTPVSGGVDLVVASELLEAARTVQAGLVSPDRTLLIASTSRTLTTHEKMALGDGRFESDRLLAVARAHSRRLVAFDMDAVARDAGTIVSAVLAGAIAGSGVLPFGREAIEAVIRESGLGVEASLRGLAQGCAAVATPVVEAPSNAAATTELRAALATAFPAEVQPMAAAGYSRLLDYQDRAYAELFLARVQKVMAIEQAIDPASARGYALTCETARFLALWMAFDDIVRVASLKCRASRFARVRREVGAKDGDLVHIHDIFKPGVPEVAGLLPPGLARPLVAWERRRQARGKVPLAMPLQVRSDGVFGFLMLRTLAALRGWRRRGARYAEEQALIGRWLSAIEAAAGSDWQLAFEIALGGRLIKGYGATNLRGKENLAHIVQHLASGGHFATPAARAEAIRQAREAALADEGGKALDAALARHGAPQRPAVVRPIVFTRKPAAHRAVPPSP